MTRIGIVGMSSIVDLVSLVSRRAQHDSDTVEMCWIAFDFAA
jgi:hypothetical protein